ncbi:TRK1 [Cyberlindnera jadinii]|uniref:Potassium transport protein n=1 Tax=Cyberlindnera jadinii (strain ATCC 18201 / CBS 1600 / BCRC 20928 / JCM 3617 / NBRC 0987 / NRRL Y-1542) TaxID=983966 RepID=A0A0H5C1P9_CYBJN|nr:TRK1 [Cyberlindnera jadinii]
MSWFSRLRQRPNTRRFLSAQTLSTLHVKKTIGWKLRDAAGAVEEKIGPYVKKVIPSFVAAHYVYIISMVILSSIVLYPVKNAPYIDILFFASGSSTQAGLNTIDLNNMKLYQQITIYIVCMLTTPIFIHGSLCVLRLYWFERYFDNIRVKSKLNFQMRRTATLAARTQTMDRFRSMDSTVPFTNRQKEDLHKIVDSSSSSDIAPMDPTAFTQSAMDLHRDAQVTHESEPSSSDEERVSPEDRQVKYSKSDDDGNDNNGIRSGINNIKFGSLPKPKREQFEPTDVMMSIKMMRDKPQEDDDEDDENGPVLVVKGPAERESSKHNRTNSQVQFSLQKPKKMRKRSGLRRSFTNRNSISESADTSDAESQRNFLQRAQSHLQLPSSDLSGGAKFVKRSNTLDPSNDEEAQMGFTPAFDRIKNKLPRGLRRRLSSNTFDNTSQVLDTSASDTEEDDEEDDSDNNSDHALRRQMSAPYLSWAPTVGRNSTFVNLSQQQKEELGGVEYRATKLLIKIISVYYVGFHILGFIFLVPWILHTHRYQIPVQESGTSLTWWGFFTSMSAFNDLGFTLTPNSMGSFNTSPYALLITSFFIVIGNTGFPILLRFIIWVMFKFSEDLSQTKESLGFLLDHPRRCFTLLFPSGPTWWLFFILVLLNAVDLILFIILDINAEVVEELTTGQKVLDGFFQAISTRTAGFTCIDLSSLHPAVQVSYMVMMYISVMPLAISIRRTNVYEEQSLGVYGKQTEEDGDERKATSFIGAHLRKQLSFDLWFVFLGLFIICIAEGGKIQNPLEPSFNIFSCMFEVVSAYGTVGLSLGYPGTNQSFSGKFDTISKLVIIAMMIRGRHRGLPYALDRAIMLPSAQMDARDRYQDLHAGHTIQRSETMGSSTDPVIEFLKGAAPTFMRKNMKVPKLFTSKSQPSVVPSRHASTSELPPQSPGRRSTEPMPRRGSESYFKNIHFGHSSEQYFDKDINLSPVNTNQNVPQVELQNMETSNNGEQSVASSRTDDDESIALRLDSPAHDLHVSETAITSPVTDEVDRRGSIYTL